MSDLVKTQQWFSKQSSYLGGKDSITSKKQAREIINQLPKDILKDKFFGIKSVPLNHEEVVNNIINKCAINQQSVAIKKSDLLAKGSYITSYPSPVIPCMTQPLLI